MTKTKMGRPFKGKYIYDQYLAFVCSKQESEQIRQIAETRKQSLSELVRNIVIKELNIITE